MKPSVCDPIGVTQDSKMTFLKQALDPRKVQDCFERHLVSTRGIKSIDLRAIQVKRYKPGRRCLIKYDVVITDNHDRRKALSLLGKARAKGIDVISYQALHSLWQNGFNDTSRDGISVAEPVGLIPEFQMWLQRNMPGVVATELLDKSQGVALALQIAEAAHKLHQADVKINRSHGISDEMSILHDRLGRVIQSKPDWEKRLNQLLDGSSQLAAALSAPATRNIHRDFYSDQVLVDGDRLYLLDFDLYCQGDPALDIGNFIGHITEYSLRNLEDPEALKDREQALEDYFVELAGEDTRKRVRIYTLLTLLRHIFLSTQFLERRAITEPLIGLCEQRLAHEFRMKT